MPLIHMNSVRRVSNYTWQYVFLLAAVTAAGDDCVSLYPLRL